jgi:hypothetical protein
MSKVLTPLVHGQVLGRKSREMSNEPRDGADHQSQFSWICDRAVHRIIADGVFHQPSNGLNLISPRTQLRPSIRKKFHVICKLPADFLQKEILRHVIYDLSTEWPSKLPTRTQWKSIFLNDRANFRDTWIRRIIPVRIFLFFFLLAWSRGPKTQRSGTHSTVLSIKCDRCATWTTWWLIGRAKTIYGTINKLSRNLDKI